jgi:Flp pilus assembly protein TadG
MPASTADRFAERQRGLAIVEFTIVVGILLMLILATAEFGRAFLQYNTLTKSVHDGARHVAGRALFGSTGTVSISPGLETETRNLVVYGNTFGAGSPILPGLSTANVTVVNAGGGNISVSAAYAYAAFFAFIPGFFYGPNTNTSGYTLQTQVTMRAL